jgi:hypothetical protein
MLTKAISKLITKIGNLGLKVDLQNARQAKLGTVTRKPPKLETKWAFLSYEAEMLSKKIPKQAISLHIYILDEKG